MDQWGIHFAVSANSSGYSWMQIPWKQIEGDEGVYLGPVRGDVQNDNTMMPPLTQRTEVLRNGAGAARDAYNEFRKLAVDLVEKPVPEYNIEGLSPEKNQEQSIINFANKHGTLWGDNDPGTLKDWQREAADFLDLLDVSRALISGDLRKVNSRIGRMRGHPDILVYRGRHRRSKPMVIVTDGDASTYRVATNALPQRTDFWKVAVEGSPHARVQMLFNGQLNQRLVGGLSLGLSVLSPQEAFVTPKHLIHLLYVRMWLDTREKMDIDLENRRMTCKYCGDEIEGRRSKQFCDDRCRWEYNNRRRALENKLIATEVG